MRDGGPRANFLFPQPREIRERRDTINRKESGEIQRKMYLLRAPYIVGGETNGPIREMEACAKNAPSLDPLFFFARGLMGRYERGKIERKLPLPGTPFTFGRASHQPVWAREGRPENAFLLTTPRTFGEGISNENALFPQSRIFLANRLVDRYERRKLEQTMSPLRTLRILGEATNLLM